MTGLAVVYANILQHFPGLAAAERRKEPGTHESFQKINWKIFVFFLCLLTPILTQAEISLSTACQNLADRLEKGVNDQEQAGYAAAVIVNGRVIWQATGGMRSVKTGEPITPETVFPLASVSKPITAALIRHLVTQHHLHLDMPITQVCGGFSHQIKVHHLLSHTTGYGAGNSNTEIGEGATWAALYKKLKQRKRKAVGKNYAYHNVTYSILGEIVEKKMKQPFAHLVKAHILTPLQMNNTVVGLKAFQAEPTRVVGHWRDEQGVLQPVADSNFMKTVVPAGGIAASLNDMVKFVQAEMQTYSPESVFFKPVAKAPECYEWLKDMPCLTGRKVGSWYALGWRIFDIDGHRLVFHGGLVRGISTFIGFLPEYNVGIVILSNTMYPGVFVPAMGFCEDVIGPGPETE